jgi:hypothetical protein
MEINFQNHDHNILDKFIIIVMLSYPKTKFREGGGTSKLVQGDNRFLKRVPPAWVPHERKRSR